MSTEQGFRRSQFFAKWTDLWGDHLGVWLLQTQNRLNDPKRFIGKPVEFTEIPEKLVSVNLNQDFQNPTVSLLKQEAQQLMDQLWSCGLRPTEGAGSAGQLSAVERHLADMQKLVFSKHPL